MSKYVIFTDGGARGNPGPAASAFVIFKDDKEFYKEGKYLGNTTNNVAEYEALIMALKFALGNVNETSTIIINSDSQLMVYQMNNLYKVKNEKIKILYEESKKLEDCLSKKNIRLMYNLVPRVKNKVSDAIVNKTLDEN